MNPGTPSTASPAEAALDPGSLQLAVRLGGLRLGGPGLPELVLVERILAHGLPQVLVLGGHEAELALPLEAAARLHGDRLGLNVLGAIVPGGPPGPALAAHRRRIGSLLCALDAGLACELGGPVLPRRLPGRIRAREPLPLPPAPLGPLEASQLLERRPELGPEGVRRVYAGPAWEPVGAAWEARLWPDVAVPAEAELLEQPLTLATATPVAEALRGALRSQSRSPVPFLPLDEAPGRLHALGAALAVEAAAFQGSLEAWTEAFLRLAVLPAPAHFCARC